MNLKNMDATALRGLIDRYDAMVMNRYSEPPLLVKAKALEASTEKTRLGSPLARAWAATALGGAVEASFTRTTDFTPKTAGMVIGWFENRIDAMKAHRNWIARDMAFRLLDLDEAISHEAIKESNAILVKLGIQPAMVEEPPAAPVDRVSDGFTDPEPPYAATKRAEAEETARQEVEAGSAANPGTVSASRKASSAVKAAADRIEKQANAKKAAAAKKETNHVD